jgi:hypothetical protein
MSCHIDKLILHISCNFNRSLAPARCIFDSINSLVLLLTSLFKVWFHLIRNIIKTPVEAIVSVRSKNVFTRSVKS